MYKFRKSSMQTWDNNKERGYDQLPKRTFGVPKKFTDTAGRRTMRRLVRILGKFFFVMMVVGMVSAGTVMIFPSLDEALHPLVMGLWFTVFASHLGMMIEIGCDSGGKNWFALAVGMFWLGLVICFFGSGFF